jgi:Trk-type K+ transport system membrane component
MESSLAIMFIFGVVPVSTFLMIWGIRYLENKENMAMIERGMDPKEHKLNRRLNPSKTLKDSLLFVGAGLGLLLAIVLSKALSMDGPGLYFALIAIFGGLGLLGAYLYERNNPPPSPEP